MSVSKLKTASTIVRIATSIKDRDIALRMYRLTHIVRSSSTMDTTMKIIPKDIATQMGRIRSIADIAMIKQPLKDIGDSTNSIEAIATPMGAGNSMTARMIARSSILKDIVTMMGATIIGAIASKMGARLRIDSMI